MKTRARVLWHWVMLHLSAHERLLADRVFWDSYDAVVDGFTRDDPEAFQRDFARALGHRGGRS